MKISSLLFSPVVLLFALTGCGEQTVNHTEAAKPAAKELSQEHYFAQLQKAAEAGNAEAQFNLGWIYMHGEGTTGVSFMRDIPKDIPKAYDWYQKAAVQGHINAQYNLGMLYKLGMGVKEDQASAIMWLQKAAAQESDIAQYHLGLMFADGAGVKQNLPRACAWLALAAARGNEKAKKSYIDLDAKLTPEQRAESQQLAVNWKKGDVI